MSAQIPTFMTFKNGEKIESMTSTDQAGLQVRARPSSAFLSSRSHCRTTGNDQ
jgi:hypothetical protein